LAASDGIAAGSGSGSGTAPPQATTKETSIINAGVRITVSLQLGFPS
jgi:hypothetical protein